MADVPATGEAVAAEFAIGGAAASFCGQWRCVKAGFEKKDGIVFLRDALGTKAPSDDALKAVGDETRWWTKGDVSNALLSPTGLRVGFVQVFKAAPGECHGRAAKRYIAFGTRPRNEDGSLANVKDQMLARMAGTLGSNGGTVASTATATTAAASSSSSSSYSSSSAVGPGYCASADGEFQYQDTARSRIFLGSIGSGGRVVVRGETQPTSRLLLDVRPSPPPPLGIGGYPAIHFRVDPHTRFLGAVYRAPARCG